MTITRIVKRFQYFNFETKFLKKENFFQKNGAPFFSLKTKIENASFPCKIDISETIVETNRLGNTK